jgi:hypothetical protein
MTASLHRVIRWPPRHRERPAFRAGAAGAWVYVEDTDGSIRRALDLRRKSVRAAGPAEGHCRAALGLAKRLTLRPLQAHCHLGLGKLHRRTGRLDEARAELAMAVAVLREMGMAFWLPEAERELAMASSAAGCAQAPPRRRGLRPAPCYAGDR